MINTNGYWIPDAVTADVILLAQDENQILTLLIERGKDPYKDYMAIPGGHMDEEDESVEECAIRETMEETGVLISNDQLNLVGVFSKKDRDPRGRYIGVVYYAWITLDELRGAEAADDASSIGIINLHSLVDEINKGKQFLAFDHDEAVLMLAENIFKG